MSRRTPSPFPFRAALLLLPALTLLIALMLPAAAHAQAFSLATKLDYAAGTTPYGVALGDVNGDGAPDLVVTNFGSNSVTVRLGDGRGAFGSGYNYATGTGPQPVAIGDVNGDGAPDLVVGNSGTTTVSVLPGTGSGSFGARTNYTVGGGPNSLALGDVNGDGRLDIVAANYNSNTLSVLIANGTGGFLAKADYATAASPQGIALGDLNRDGRLDVAAAGYSANKVSILLGNGDGTFGAKTDYTTNTQPRGLALADLDGNGDLDLVVADYGANMISVLLGNGNGTFGAKSDYAVGNGPTAVAVRDLDGDGAPDVIATNWATGSVWIYQNAGDGAIGTATTVSVQDAYAVAVADVNGDGYPDLATANTGTAKSTILLAYGNGYFRSRTSRYVGSNPERVAIGDLNRDGYDDVVTTLGALDKIVVMLGSPTGPGTAVTYTTGDLPRSVAIGDVDLDGNLDVVTANGAASSVSVFLGDGSGALGPKTDHVMPGSYPFDVLIGDMNRDGYPDIVTADYAQNKVSMQWGDANRASAFGSWTAYTVGTAPVSLATGDFNRDGNPDLVVANQLSNSVSVLLNGTPFFSVSPYPAGTNPSSVSVADLNGDLNPDIIIANLNSNSMDWLPGTGTGTFGSATMNATGGSPYVTIARDLNGDGRADVVTANYGDGTATIQCGTGAGLATTRHTVAIGAHAEGMAIGDVNGDDQPDLVVANYDAQTISTVLGLSRCAVSLAVSPNPVVAGNALTLTATVTGIGTAEVPASFVWFYDGETPLGAARASGGSAMYGTLPALPGTRTLTAIYQADGIYYPVVSAPRALRVVSSAKPLIASIKDVGSDQGGVVRLRFRSSPFDYVGSPTPITQYDVFRRVNTGYAATRTPAVSAARPASAQVDGWDFVGTVSAYGDSAYTLLVPTFADSNASGMHRLALFVRAATATPTQFFDSAVDSGYSVDNLAPATPAGLAAALGAGAVSLHWDPNHETDLAGYVLYRGSTSGFVPGPGNLLAITTDTFLRDGGGVPSWYKLAAMDVNGNMSGYAVIGPDGTADVPDAPVAFALESVRPNPAPTGRLSVTFALPSSSPARLELLDVSGRRVLAREVGALGAGRHVIELGSGERLAPGLYLVRLSRGGDACIARVTILH